MSFHRVCLSFQEQWSTNSHVRWTASCFGQMHSHLKAERVCFRVREMPAFLRFQHWRVVLPSCPPVCYSGCKLECWCVHLWVCMCIYKTLKPGMVEQKMHWTSRAIPVKVFTETAKDREEVIWLWGAKFPTKKLGIQAPYSFPAAS